MERATDGVLKPTTKELVHAASGGDQASWEALVDRFAGVVWSVTRGLRLDRSDAADVFQTTWLRLVEHLDRIEQPDRLGAWLATTARREGLRVLRLSGRQIPCVEETMINLSDVSETPPENGLVVEERDCALREAFAHLPRRCQLILGLLTRDAPASYRELGEALQMPIGSIGPTRARCLEHLRRLAAAAGVFLPDDPSS